MPPSHDDNPCQEIISLIKQKLSRSTSPLVIALDGGSGCGKSTIAKCISEEVNASIIPCDDFFAATITDDEWDAKEANERARDAIDWRRLRTEALEPLLRGQSARWNAFDFESGQAADGTYKLSSEFKILDPNPIIILDGIYSAREELSDLVNLSVLVDVPIAIRHARLNEREEATFLKAWHERWDKAEAWYLSKAKPPQSFDLIVRN